MIRRLVDRSAIGSQVPHVQLVRVTARDPSPSRRRCPGQSRRHRRGHRHRKRRHRRCPRPSLATIRRLDHRAVVAECPRQVSLADERVLVVNCRRTSSDPYRCRRRRPHRHRTDRPSRSPPAPRAGVQRIRASTFTSSTSEKPSPSVSLSPASQIPSASGVETVVRRVRTARSPSSRRSCRRQCRWQTRPGQRSSESSPSRTDPSLSSSGPSPSSHRTVAVEVRTVVGDVGSAGPFVQSSQSVDLVGRPAEGVGSRVVRRRPVSATESSSSSGSSVRTVSSPGRYRAVREVVAASRRRRAAISSWSRRRPSHLVDVRIGIAVVVVVRRPRRHRTDRPSPSSPPAPSGRISNGSVRTSPRRRPRRCRRPYRCHPVAQARRLSRSAPSFDGS